MTSERTNPEPTSVRREIALYIGTLFAGGLLVAVVAFLLVLPLLTTAQQAILFLVLIVAADLVVVFLFVRGLVDRLVLRPVMELTDSAEAIAGGDLDHRAPEQSSEEFHRLALSLNRMAEQLITDQRKLEENVRSLDRTNQELVETTDQLMQTARMASVGTLAAGIAHEVGNPLGAILGYVDAARSRLGNGRDAEPLLDSVRDEARRIDRIVRSLLEYSRPNENGDRPPSGAGVHDTVERAVDLLEAQGVLSGIGVQRELPEELPEIAAHAQPLEQVVVNLLLNAAQALEENGGRSITIAAHVEEGGVRPAIRPRRKDDPPGVDYSHRRRWARISDPKRSVLPLSEGRRVVLRVEDDGPGIPPEALPRIFDPFFTTKDPGRGVGLGLSLSARIAESMGGSLEAANREDGGARFELRLPLCEETAPQGA